MRRLGIIAVAICVTMGAAAPSCIVEQDYTGTAEGSKLLFVGDSITALSVNQINTHFADRYQVRIHGWVGATTYGFRNALPLDAGTRPDMTVVNFGTNDVVRVITGVSFATADGSGTIVLEPVEPISAVLDRLDAMVAAFAPGCVVVVTVNSHATNWSEYQPYGEQVAANIAVVNDHIRSTFAHVADWDAAWQPGYFDGPDQPHPNAVGKQALLELEDAAMAGCDAPT